MNSLFIYGILRHPPLRAIVLGPDADVRLRPGRLPDHIVREAPGSPFPLLVREPGRMAEGLVIEGLGDAEFARLDFFECGFQYTLTEAVLEDGTRTLVYVPQAPEVPRGEVWSLERWAARAGEMVCHSATEDMSYMGRKSAQQVSGMLPMMLARGWARVNAASARHGAGTFRGKVTVERRERAYAHFFALDDYLLTHDRFDGGRSEPLDRAVLVATDAVIVLPYDPVRDRVLLVEQFRMGPFARGDASPWQMEPVAGRIDAGETPQDAARREAQEEAGLALADLLPVAEVYPSPGTSTEFYYIYVAIADLPDAAAGIGGLADEHEDIRSHLMSFDALMEMCDAQAAANAPLALAAYWLARHRERLRAKP